ncbi:type I-E CRISPR-associated protein Cas7/Cse4/CasC [Parascardovia denticolens]
MSNQNLYVDINILQTVPSSNINRDDSGSPKTAVYGGVTRARVSSQSWKRAVRQAFREANKDEWLNSHRTKKAVQILADRLLETDSSLVDEDAALEKSKSIFSTAGIKLSKDKKTGEYLTGALLLLSNGQLNKLAEFSKDNEGLDEADKDLKKILNGDQSLDLALFGRMVADNPELNVDASAQVAHAISTHEIVPEFDYYTALDDDQIAENAGSAMIGTIEYNSATLYRYANVNMNELVHNIGRDLAIKGLELFIKDFVMSMPTGKQNTFANKTLPQYVMVAVRQDTPVNLVSAFEEPVRSRNGYINPSISKLEKEFTDSLRFVQEPLLTEVITTKKSAVGEQTDGLDELLKKVTELLEKEISDDSSND